MSKASIVANVCNSLGREFRSLGPSTENARWPHKFSW